MKKFIYVLILIALGWLIKLSYDFYQVSQQLNELQQSLHKSEQKNASLNDQLVAVQRQTEEPSKNNSQKTASTTTSPPISGLNPSVLVKQQLELVQFAMQQQQFIYAFEHLTVLNHALDQYALADATKQSLHQTIAQDMQSIQQFMSAKNTQQDRLTSVMKLLDQQLEQMLKNNQLSAAKTEPEHFWQKWIQVDRVAVQSPEFTSRKLVYKEIQLRLLLARQLLAKGQNVEFQDTINQTIQLLDELPDHDSQKLQQQLLQLKQIPQLPVPKLNSFAVVG